VAATCRADAAGPAGRPWRRLTYLLPGLLLLDLLGGWLAEWLLFRD